MRRRNACVAISAAVLSLSLSSSFSLATPYATGVTESGGVVSFTLNEPATQVTVIRDGVSQNLGAQNSGTVSFNRNGATNYQIQISNVGGIGYATQIAPNTGGALPMFQDTNETAFYGPRGIAVNTFTNNPALFGRVYVSNPIAGTTGVNPNIVRNVGQGIYVLNSNMTDALGQGDTPLTAGLDADFANGGGSSPWRLTVGADNNLYISDWSSTTGTVYQATPNVTNGINILIGQGGNATSHAPNHGSINGAAVVGTQAAGNFKLYTVDEDFGGANNYQAVERYDVNSSPFPYAGLPTQLAAPLIPSFNGVYCALARNPVNGMLYAMQNRSAGNEASIFAVRDDGSSGTVVWDSLSASTADGLDADPSTAGTQDIIRQARGVACSPDGKYLAIVRNDSTVVVMPLDANGIPDLTKRIVINGAGTPAFYGRDIAFDAADNIYAVASGLQNLRVYSPGGISTTTLGSDGSFSVQNYGAAEWTANSTGNANDSTKWFMNTVPNSSGAGAKFGSAITSNTTINFPAATTLGDILFDNASASYTLAGPGTITLNAPVATPTIMVASGNHTVSAPLALGADSAVTVPAGSTLTLSGGINGNGHALSANSAGTTVIAGNLNVGALNLSNGTVVQLAGNTNRVTSLNIVLDQTLGYRGTLDLGTKGLVINYDPNVGTPSGDVAGEIDNARNGGAWNQPGITSSAVKADTAHKTIIYTEASDFFGLSGAQTATWDGQTVDNHSLLLRATWFGDANLDGRINGDDYAAIDRAMAKGGQSGWKNGDFDGNGVINSNDYLLLDESLILSGGAPLSPDLLAAREAQFGPAYVAALTAAVPEPASLGLLAAAGLGLLSRRRRNA